MCVLLRTYYNIECLKYINFGLKKNKIEETRMHSAIFPKPLYIKNFKIRLRRLVSQFSGMIGELSTARKAGDVK